MQWFPMGIPFTQKVTHCVSPFICCVNIALQYIFLLMCLPYFSPDVTFGLIFKRVCVLVSSFSSHQKTSNRNEELQQTFFLTDFKWNRFFYFRTINTDRFITIRWKIQRSFKNIQKIQKIQKFKRKYFLLQMPH